MTANILLEININACRHRGAARLFPWKTSEHCIFIPQSTHAPQWDSQGKEPGSQIDPHPESGSWLYTLAMAPWDIL